MLALAAWQLKKRNCPICRSSITNQVHTKVLDDFIEKFVDGFVPEAFKNSRKELLEDRKRKKESREKLETEDRNRRLIHANRVDRSLEEIPDGSFGNPRSPFVPDSDSEDGLNIWVNSGSRWNFGISRERTSSGSSSTSSTPSSPMANRPEMDSSESDTTWSPPPSEEMNVISEKKITNICFVHPIFSSFRFWCFGHFSCVIFSPVFFLSCPSRLAKCKQRLHNIVVFS